MKPVVKWTIVLAMGMAMGGPSLLLAQEGGGRGGMETAYAQLIRDLLPRAIDVVEQAAES